jgi:glutathione S-transferase
LKESQIPFTEIRLPLFTPEWEENIGRLSPSRRVPVLWDGDWVVWDSMAIFEYVLERFPNAVGWSSEAQARSHARSIAAEMHAGFQAVREELPQNVRRRGQKQMSEFSAAARSQIARIQDIWRECRQEYGSDGPWLFGPLSIADIVYAPVALRFLTYGIPLEDDARHFVERVDALPSVQEWIAASQAESETLEFIDDLLPEGARMLG